MCEAVVTLSNNLSKEDELQTDGDVCWICHEGNSAALPLAAPCQCRAMRAHRQCLARWQLQQAGKEEERSCRFCKAELPDWRDAHASMPKATPIMTVVHNGVTHQVTVEPGPDGQQKFQDTIRKIFNLGDSDAIQLTFGCRVPGAGHEVTLEGWNAFDAAVHCAAISAGQRMQQQQQLEGQTPQGKKTVERKSSSSGTGGVLRRLFSRGSPA